MSQILNHRTSKPLLIPHSVDLLFIAAIHYRALSFLWLSDHNILTACFLSTINYIISFNWLFIVLFQIEDDDDDARSEDEDMMTAVEMGSSRHVTISTTSDLGNDESDTVST